MDEEIKKALNERLWGLQKLELFYVYGLYGFMCTLGPKGIFVLSTIIGPKRSFKKRHLMIKLSNVFFPSLFNFVF